MDTSSELMLAVITILKADATVNSFVNGRIYDRVAEKRSLTDNVVSPYLNVEIPTITTDDYDCIDAETLTLQVNAWSWGDKEAYSSTQCRNLSRAIKKALNKKEIVLNVNGFVSLRHLTTRIIRADDGITNHGAVLFESEIDAI